LPARSSVTKAQSVKIEGQIVIDQNDMSTNLDNDEEGVSENLLRPAVKVKKDDFQFVKVVGRGSFGKVYLVKKKDNPAMPLAMKVLNKDMVSKRNLLIKTQGKF
jgi:serine/threonine protein kinase